MGQHRPAEKEELFSLLHEFVDVFVENPSMFPACKGEAIRLRLKDPRCAPYMSPERHKRPEERKKIQAEVEKLKRNESIRESYSS